VLSSRAAVSDVIAVILPIFSFILVGMAAARLNLLGAGATDVLNKFVVCLALPALLFEAMSQVRWVDVAKPGFLLAVGGGMAATFIAAAMWGGRRGRTLADRSILGLGASFSNAGFMGIPLCRLALGEVSLVPAIIATVMTASVLFACAIVIIESDLQAESGFTRTAFKVGRTLIRNPLLMAPAAGAMFAVSGLPMPAALASFSKLLGGAATPCALIALGLFLAERKIDFEPAVIARLVGLKLLMQPAVVGALAFGVVNLPPVWAKTALLMSALPTGTGPFMLSRLYAREGSSISGTILVSTALSFATVSGLLLWFAITPGMK
jgi:malonate transporter